MDIQTSVVASEQNNAQQQSDLVQVVAPAPPPPSPSPPGLFSNQAITIGIIALQAVGLVGATVTGELLNWISSGCHVDSSGAKPLPCTMASGTLARRRRQEMEKINTQLREINSKLRSQSADEGIPSNEEVKSIQEYRLSLHASFAENATIHQTSEELQMSEQRQQLLGDIRLGRDFLDKQDYTNALEVLQKALLLSRDLDVLPATRAIMRLKARAYKEMQQYEDSLKCLEKVLLVSIAMEEYSGDADVCGEIADMYTQIGDLEQAAEYYDRYLAAISNGLPSNLSSTWDMA
eukprot:scaffold647909_cov47-Prasinocladus_malaysianus.AAC.2